MRLRSFAAVLVCAALVAGPSLAAASYHPPPTASIEASATFNYLSPIDNSGDVARVHYAVFNVSQARLRPERILVASRDRALFGALPFQIDLLGRDFAGGIRGAAASIRPG